MRTNMNEIKGYRDAEKNARDYGTSWTNGEEESRAKLPD